jgi:hypothetical protein
VNSCKKLKICCTNWHTPVNEQRIGEPSRRTLRHKNFHGPSRRVLNRPSAIGGAQVIQTVCPVRGHRTCPDNSVGLGLGLGTLTRRGATLTEPSWRQVGDAECCPFELSLETELRVCSKQIVDRCSHVGLGHITPQKGFYLRPLAPPFIRFLFFDTSTTAKHF